MKDLGKMNNNNCMFMTPLIQDGLNRASSLAREGDELIQNSHYAEDSIQPKCSELRVISENVSSSLRDRKEHLVKAMELHRSLERVRKTHMVYFLCLVCCCCFD